MCHHTFISISVYNTVRYGVITASVKVHTLITRGRGDLNSRSLIPQILKTARHGRSWQNLLRVLYNLVKYCQAPQNVRFSASGCVTAVFCVLPRWRGCSGVDRGSGCSEVWRLCSHSAYITHHTSHPCNAVSGVTQTISQPQGWKYGLIAQRQRHHLYVRKLETILLIRVSVLYNIFYPSDVPHKPIIVDILESFYDFLQRNVNVQW